MHQVMRGKPGVIVVLAVAVTFVSGCATTREDRIRQHQALFTSWPADVRENIRNGEIRIGYSEEMVRLALGEPDRNYVRETDEGQTSIWGYASELNAYHRSWPASSWVYSSHINGDYWYHRTFARPYWHIQAHEYEHLRIEFRDGNVISIERLMRHGEEN